MKQAERLETVAENPRIVEIVKAKARERGDIPTKWQVLNMVGSNDGGKGKKGDSAFKLGEVGIKELASCGEFHQILTALDELEVTDRLIQDLSECYNGVNGVVDLIYATLSGVDKLYSIVYALQDADGGELYGEEE
jgi:hypothetical protein